MTLLLCWTPDPQDPWQHEGEENAPKVSVGLGGEIYLWRDFFPFSLLYVCKDCIQDISAFKAVLQDSVGVLQDRFKGHPMFSGILRIF